MIKYLTLLFAIIASTQCQRPPYAGSSNRIPAVLPQYLPADQTQSTTFSSSTINNRFNTNDNVNNNNNFANSPDLSNLPIDAHGDIELINRIKTWPKEKQPFWYINWRQIEEHRGGSNSRSTNRPASTIVTSARPYFRSLN